MFAMTPAEDNKFAIGRYFTTLMQHNAFFASISRWMPKRATRAIPTAAVAWDQRTDEIAFYYNDLWFSELAAENEAQVFGVITHELYHIIFRHITARRRDPNILWNIATDCAINSIIVYLNQGTLPDCVLLPGKKPKAKAGAQKEEEKKGAIDLGEIIEKFPKSMASEWYFEQLKKELEDKLDQLQGTGMSGEGSMDDHSGWDGIPDNKRSYVEGKIRGMVSRATREADAQSNGWGNIPAELREDIRASVSGVVDWRRILKQFISTLNRGERSTTFKRINRRYPMMYPGMKRAHTPRLLMAIDQSGSVDDGSLGLIAGELASLTKMVTIDVLPFDHTVAQDQMFEWKKGQKLDNFERVRSGGTSFDAPVEFVNRQENRGKWDGMIIMTDGECSAPGPSRVKMGYVIVPGHKLAFETSDIVANMSDNQSKDGAWHLGSGSPSRLAHV